MTVLQTTLTMTYSGLDNAIMEQDVEEIHGLVLGVMNLTCLYTLHITRDSIVSYQGGHRVEITIEFAAPVDEVTQVTEYIITALGERKDFHLDAKTKRL